MALVIPAANRPPVSPTNVSRQEIMECGAERAISVPAIASAARRRSLTATTASSSSAGSVRVRTGIAMNVPSTVVRRRQRRHQCPIVISVCHKGVLLARMLAERHLMATKQ